MVPALRGERYPEEEKPRRGADRAGANYSGSAPHSRGEQSPEGEGVIAGAGQTAGGCVQRQEGMNRPGKPGTAP